MKLLNEHPYLLEEEEDVELQEDDAPGESPTSHFQPDSSISPLQSRVSLRLQTTISTTCPELKLQKWCGLIHS